VPTRTRYSGSSGRAGRAGDLPRRDRHRGDRDALRPGLQQRLHGVGVVAHDRQAPARRGREMARKAARRVATSTPGGAPQHGVSEALEEALERGEVLDAPRPPRVADDTMSARCSRIGRTSSGIADAGTGASPSVFTMMSAPISRAASRPLVNATARPRLTGKRTTRSAAVWPARPPPCRRSTRRRHEDEDAVDPRDRPRDLAQDAGGRRLVEAGDLHHTVVIDRPFAGRARTVGLFPRPRILTFPRGGVKDGARARAPRRRLRCSGAPPPAAPGGRRHRQLDEPLPGEFPATACRSPVPLRDRREVLRTDPPAFPENSIGCRSTERNHAAVSPRCGVVEEERYSWRTTTSLRTGGTRGARGVRAIRAAEREADDRGVLGQIAPDPGRRKAATRVRSTAPASRLIGFSPRFAPAPRSPRRASGPETSRSTPPARAPSAPTRKVPGSPRPEATPPPAAPPRGPIEDAGDSGPSAGGCAAPPGELRNVDVTASTLSGDRRTRRQPRELPSSRRQGWQKTDQNSHHRRRPAAPRVEGEGAPSASVAANSPTCGTTARSARPRFGGAKAVMPATGWSVTTVSRMPAHARRTRFSIIPSSAGGSRDGPCGSTPRSR